MIAAAPVAALLAAYDGFGLRRAGSVGDLACADWLLSQLAIANVDARGIDVALNVRTVQEAAIECESLRIDGLPLFDAPDTLPEGIVGALGGAIELIDADPSAASIKGQPLEAQRKASSGAAMVIATRGAGGSLAPINAQYFGAPFGPPALQVAGLHLAELATLAARGASARMVVRSERTSGVSRNIDARTGNRPTLVLLTPRTSWWESTAERAGGIVAWLAGLRQAASQGIAVRGFATCGHELGHLGLERVLHDEAPLVTGAKCWLHLGANLGCASDGRLTVRASKPNDGDHLRTLLVAHGYPASLIEIEPIERAMGEARDLADHGARVLSLIGRNAHFHAPSDRWPGNVSAAWVASVASAVGAWLAEYN